uniref:Uncharacterized protein n=1 Tax=Arundo donax TaxID=35708 RepID=A0A0A9BED8_ARUDO
MSAHEFLNGIEQAMCKEHETFSCDSFYC